MIPSTEVTIIPIATVSPTETEENISSGSICGRLISKGLSQLKDVGKIIGTTLSLRPLVALGMHFAGARAPQNLPVSNITTGMVIRGAILEELIFRGVIQEGVLRRLPKVLMERYFPNHADLVDAKIFQISRVALSSILFAMAHRGQWSASLADCSQQILGGAIKGYFVETRGIEALICCSIAHAVLNGLCLLLIQE